MTVASSKLTEDGARLITLFQIEKEMREAENVTALHHVIVNRLRAIAPYDQAILYHLQDQKLQPVAANDVVQIDPNAPLFQWLKSVVDEGHSQGKLSEISGLYPEDIAPTLKQGWTDWAMGNVLWFPLHSKNGGQIGGLWLTRATPFKEEEKVILARALEVAAHALWAMRPRYRLSWSLLFSRKTVIASFALIALSFVIPIRQSVIAPAQVIAAKPMVVAAPMNGVIEKVWVDPNKTVSQGDVLLSYERTDLEGELSLIDEEVATARSELFNANQAAFVDARMKAKIATLQSRLDLARAKQTYAQKRVSQINIKSPSHGVAIFNDPAELMGLPVKVGQRLMTVANPDVTQLKIDLPVADAVPLPSGAAIRLFLDKSPLAPKDAVLNYSSYDPYIPPSGVLSFRLIADFPKGQEQSLGLRGVAKIYGERVSLFYYLFRRPLTRLRQITGF